MTLSCKFLKFPGKICAQRMKLCEKVVLFTSLGGLIKNWLFGEISKLWGPKSPRDVREHTLKFFSWTFLIYRYWKLALFLLGYIWSEMISLSTCCAKLRTFLIEEFTHNSSDPQFLHKRPYSYLFFFWNTAGLALK